MVSSLGALAGWGAGELLHKHHTGFVELSVK